MRMKFALISTLVVEIARIICHQIKTLSSVTYLDQLLSDRYNKYTCEDLLKKADMCSDSLFLVCCLIFISPIRSFAKCRASRPVRAGGQAITPRDSGIPSQTRESAEILGSPEITTGPCRSSYSSTNLRIAASIKSLYGSPLMRAISRIFE